MQLWGKWEPVYRPLGIDGDLLFRSDDTTVAGDGYPQQLTDYYEREREWLTATRMGVDAGVRCHIRRFYIDLSGRYEGEDPAGAMPDRNDDYQSTKYTGV